MNPPAQKKFSLTIEVTAKSSGRILSFDQVSTSIVSSLSSGALADHSSLSESNESFPHLTAHSSTSTSSSGLSASRAAKQPAKPCQCCGIFNYLKLRCVCRNGNLLFVRDVSSSKDGVEGKDSARLPEVCSDMDLTDPVVSDRRSPSPDIVDPAEETEDVPEFQKIRLSVRPECNVSTDSKGSEEDSDDVPVWWTIPKWEQLLAWPEELPLYRRPPMIPTHYKEDKRGRFLLILWLSNTLYAYENGDDPPTAVTRVFYDPRVEPLIPEDYYKSLNRFSDGELYEMLKRFQDICHLAKAKAAAEGLEFPEFADVEEREEEKMQEDAYELISETSETQSTSDFPLNQMQFDPRYYHPQYEEYAGPHPSTSTSDPPPFYPRYYPQYYEYQEYAGPQPSTSTAENYGPFPSASTSNDPPFDPRYYQYYQEGGPYSTTSISEPGSPQPSVSVSEYCPYPSTSTADLLPFNQRLYERFYQEGVPDPSTSIAETGGSRHIVHVASNPEEEVDVEGPPPTVIQTGDCDSKFTLVYAKVQKWYYPGWMECSIEHWDNTTEPITVHFYDDSPDRNLAPDMILPLQRLPAGATCQRQLENSIYDDIFYFAFTPSSAESEVPTAVLHIMSGGSKNDNVSFSCTALSPKNVIRIRSGITSSLFYPSKSRVNFTELTKGAIIDNPSRRKAAAESEEKIKKRKQGSQRKKKTEAEDTTSSSSEAAESAPKKRKIEEAEAFTEASITSPEAASSTSQNLNIEVISTSVVEPSSTEASITSPEEAPPSTSQKQNIEVISTPVFEPSFTEEPSSPEAAPAAPQEQNIEVGPTHVVEPSATEASISSPEAAPKKRKIEVSSTPVVEPSSTETSITSPEAAPSTSQKQNIKVISIPVVESSSTEASFTSPQESNVAYLCTAPGCGRLFDSEKEILIHRFQIKKNKKRQHLTMQVVSRSEYQPTASCKVKTIKKQVNVAGPSKPSGSKTIRFSLPQPVSITDSETDTGSSPCTSRWGRHVQGYGLQPEKCVLSDEVKSFTQLKGGKKAKYPSRTELFSTQHFILTNGPSRTFIIPRKRAADSESESTDVENYYSTPLPFDVLKLQQAIECGGGRIYADFNEIPAEIRKNPGHNLIVVSGHPTCTANYIYGVALGCTIVRHDTIFDCVRRKVSLRDALNSGSASLLPPGWCEKKMTWAPPRASTVHPLRGLMFFLALNVSKESKDFWCSLVRHLGGKPIAIEWQHQGFARVDSTVNGIIADPKIAHRLASQAYDRGVPVVTTAWVIQAVVTGRKPPFSPYQVTVGDSSS